jgi:hypothetical protein
MSRTDNNLLRRHEMKVIVEGPDNSGKTTLATQLALDLDLEYRRPPTLSSTSGVNDHVFQWWESQLHNHEHDSAVYDRCTYISDPIYRLVSGFEPIRYEMDMMRGVAQVREQAFIVFCLPPWQTVKPMLEAEAAEGGGLKYLDMDHARVVHWAYFIEHRRWSFMLPAGRVAVWNYDIGRLAEVKGLYNMVLQRIKEAQDAVGSDN